MTIVEFKGDLQRLELKPGDKFVLTTDMHLPSHVHQHMQAVWRDFVGGDRDDLRLLILDGGVKLGVINGEAARTPHPSDD